MNRSKRPASHCFHVHAPVGLFLKGHSGEGLFRGCIYVDCGAVIKDDKHSFYRRNKYYYAVPKALHLRRNSYKITRERTTRVRRRLYVPTMMVILLLAPLSELKVQDTHCLHAA